MTGVVVKRHSKDATGSGSSPFESLASGSLDAARRNQASVALRGLGRRREDQRDVVIDAASGEEFGLPPVMQSSGLSRTVQLQRQLTGFCGRSPWAKGMIERQLARLLKISTDAG